MQFERFRCMVERPGRVPTRERQLERVRGWESEVDTRSIDAHIGRLRLKLGPARHRVETHGRPRLSLRQLTPPTSL